MSVQVEKLEKNMAKLTVEVSAEDFKAAIKKAFNKNKNRFAIPGFRKGKAPQAMIEKMYGEGVFYEDAADEAINASYAEAMKESGLDIVSRPEVTIEKIGKDEPFVYSALVAVKPEVTLGQYKGVEVEKADASVSAEDVEAELKKVQEQNARLLTVEDRGVEDGDQTVIDFEGFVDGKGFEGGKAEDYPLTIGSHSFIDTFEEQLIGKKIGEECEVNVTFPTEYHAADLAGKPATFKVTVKEIKVKELPELNDEFASEVHIKLFTTGFTQFFCLSAFLENSITASRKADDASCVDVRVISQLFCYIRRKGRKGESSSEMIPDGSFYHRVDLITGMECLDAADVDLFCKFCETHIICSFLFLRSLPRTGCQ